MKRLLLTDIHANLSAFEAVLADAGPFDEAVFLGDIVDCGPHPSECVDLLADVGAQCIVGNHDEGVLTAVTDGRQRRQYADWQEWTHDQLGPDRISYIASFPRTRCIASCGRQALLIHQVPGAPYLHESMTDEQVAHHFAPLGSEVVYSGHCHRLIDREIDGRRFVSFRAVGQHRDGDTRASYAIEQDGVLTHRAVAYDVARVAHDIERIGMDPAFTARYAAFVRNAYDVEWSRDRNPYDGAG